jgi:Co/Zn/Cd efflux system component
VSSLNLIRLGALGALLAGVAWTVVGLVAMATVGGRGSEDLSTAFLGETLYLVALVGTLGGIVGLHARQTPNYGRLGTAGFLAAFTGTAILLVGLMLSFLLGGLFGAAFLDPVLGAGLWCVIVGFVLLGTATLRLEALPRWCSVPLMVCLPLAIALGDFGGGIVLGLLWLAVGYALLFQHDVSALLRTRNR